MSDTPKKPKVPCYRQRGDQGLVTLTDAHSKRRRDYWLGPYAAPASRELYHRVIADWEAGGRRWPTLRSEGPAADANALTIAELVRQYWRWAQGYYHPRRAGAIKTALRLLRQYYGQTPAPAFGPRKLRLLREQMVRGDAQAEPPRMPWSRRYVNSQVQCLRHVFKWAAAQELLPAAAHQGLCALEPLRRGRTAARENPKVGPVPEYLLEATLPQLSPPVRALVELQRLSGARPGELLALRPCDLQMDPQAGVWTYRPHEHKNAFREQERILYLGPRAQAVIAPFLLGRATQAYLFSPAEAEASRRQALRAARKTPLSCGNRPGTHRREHPEHQPGQRYTTDSYRKAIEYACAKAFPPPAELAAQPGETRAQWRARLTGEQKAQLRAWRKEHRWHPHQLRHNAATELRRSFGLEAAQLALGHASAQITDAVYAERDQAKVMEVMRRIG